jgi:BASS family bile acid:Na+ symporter
MTEILELLFKISVYTFVVVGMISMGLKVTVRQIIDPLKDIKLVSLALIANFVMSPLLVYLIIYFIPVSEAEKIGFLLLSVAAGAPFLPKLAEIADSDIAYSIGIMLLLMILTVFFMPVVLPFMLPGTEVNSLSIARSLITLMIIPLFAALFFRQRFEKTAAKLFPPTKIITDISLLLLIVALVGLNYSNLLNMFGTTMLAIILLLVGTTIIGYFMGGKDKDKKVVMSLCTGQRNISAALLVAAENFKDKEIILTLVAISIIGLLFRVPYARWIGKRVKSRK